MNTNVFYRAKNVDDDVKINHVKNYILEFYFYITSLLSDVANVILM